MRLNNVGQLFNSIAQLGRRHGPIWVAQLWSAVIANMIIDEMMQCKLLGGVSDLMVVAANQTPTRLEMAKPRTNAFRRYMHIESKLPDLEA